MLDLKDHAQVQDNLLLWHTDFKERNARRTALMKTMDALNQSMGNGKVFMAAQGIDKAWSMKSSYRSPCYTSNWNDIPKTQ